MSPCETPTPLVLERAERAVAAAVRDLHFLVSSGATLVYPDWAHWIGTWSVSTWAVVQRYRVPRLCVAEIGISTIRAFGSGGGGVAVPMDVATISAITRTAIHSCWPLSHLRLRSSCLARTLPRVRDGNPGEGGIVKRLLRWSWNALTVLSLLLCVATVVLWVQSRSFRGLASRSRANTIARFSAMGRRRHSVP
jgi:hypothetical protein